MGFYQVEDRNRLVVIDKCNILSMAPMKHWFVVSSDYPCVNFQCKRIGELNDGSLIGYYNN